jgi:diamine N-acetyltransferase
MNTIIRPATQQDLQALGDMYYEFQEYHAALVPTHLRSLGSIGAWDRSSFTKAIQDILKNDDAMLYIADVDGEWAGLIEVYMLKSDDDPCVVPMCSMEIQSLFVLQAFRNHGIAHQLIATAREWAKHKGATEIILGVWENNQQAREFYARLGFTTLHRRLGMPV